MAQANRVHSTQGTTASEFLIAINRLQISLIVRDPFLAAAFRAAEDDDLASDQVERDNPKTLDGGAAELIGDAGRQVLAMVEG